MAFGTELGGSWGKLALSLFRVVAIGLIGYYLYDLVRKKRHKGLLFSVSLVFAGALGNILDSVFYGLMFNKSCSADHTQEYCRNSEVAEIVPLGEGYADVFYGRVVDMMHFKVKWPDWVPSWGGEEVFPFVFNVADSAITIGVIIIILRSRTFFPEETTFNWNVRSWFKKSEDPVTEPNTNQENQTQTTEDENN